MNKINEQYKYANNIIVIFGFKNIIDYTSVISYNTLKNNTLIICENVNKTMDEFKKLFNLKKFDLGRINYVFKTISQVYSFFKKLLNELSIPCEIYKHAQKIYVRLIQTNIIYINNIMNMTDIGYLTKSPQLTSKSGSLTLAASSFDDLTIGDNLTGKQVLENSSRLKIHKLSEIVVKYGKKPVTKEFIFMGAFDLSKLNYVFDCVSELDIEIYDKTIDNASQFYTVELSWIGNNVFYEKTFSLQNNCVINKTLIPIYFSKYQPFSLRCVHNTNTLFKVIITGFKFKSGIPVHYQNEKILIDIFNTTNPEKNELFACGGMMGFKYSAPTINEVIKDISSEEMTDYFTGDDYYCKNLAYYKTNNKISERMLKICDCDVLITTINNNMDDAKNTVKKHSDDLMYFVILGKYAEHNRSFLSENTTTKNYGLEINTLCNLSKYDYSAINGKRVKLIYNIHRLADLITKITIINKFTKNYDIKINVNFENVDIFETILSTSNLLPVIFDIPISMINKSCNNVYLTIEIPIEHINEWTFLTYELSYVYLPNSLRLMLVDN
jgi:hypothetical protein